MAVSGVLGKSNLDGMQIGVEPPDEIYAGLPTLLRVRLRNRRRWWPLFLLRVDLLDAAVTFVVVGGGEERRELLPVTVHGRGRRQLATLRVTSRFPVNFFIRSRALVLDQELLVFPTPQAVLGATDARSGELDGELASRRRGTQGEVARIADYSGREPLKSVHWKLSARHDVLKVKEFAVSVREPLLIELEELPGAGLEERLRMACYLVTRAAREGRAVGLRLPERLLPPVGGEAHKLRLLRELALYGQD